MKEFRYETAWEVTDIDSCAFYHFMDLPGIGEVRGRERTEVGNQKSEAGIY